MAGALVVAGVVVFTRVSVTCVLVAFVLVVCLFVVWTTDVPVIVGWAPFCWVVAVVATGGGGLEGAAAPESVMAVAEAEMADLP